MATIDGSISASGAAIVAAVAGLGVDFDAAIALGSSSTVAAIAAGAASTVSSISTSSANQISALAGQVVVLTGRMDSQTTLLRNISTGINSLLGVLSSTLLVSPRFPMEITPEENGGAYSFSTGDLHRAWSVSLYGGVPAAVDQTYTLRTRDSSGNITRYACKFLSLPQAQGALTVALVDTTNGRWVLWRT